MENKQKIIDDLKSRCQQKLAFLKENNQKTLVFQTIYSFLNDGEEFFLSAESELAINVLMDLDFEKEDAKRVYLTLISRR